MKILLISGHGAGDSGAVGNGFKEADLTRELVNLIVPKLRKYAMVDVYDQKRNAFNDCNNGTFKIGSYDYVLEVHFNAFNGSGHGVEIYVTSSEKAYTVEQNIVNNVAKVGFTNRGVKRTDFLVIKTVKNKGISSALLETCFIDNKGDMDVYKAKKNAIADAVVNGIAEGFGLKASSGGSKPSTPKPQPPKPSTGTKYKVGDTVNINGVYTSSSSTTKLKPAKTSGKITKIVTGTKNPYLLDNGNLGWVNDSCITGKKGSSSANASKPKTLKVGMKAKPKKAVSYDDVKLDSFVTKKYFKVIEVKGKRVVLGDGLNTAFNIDNLTY